MRGKGVALSLMVLAAAPVQAQRVSADSAINSYFQQVRGLYSGERARATVAYVEQFWRVVGNRGFQRSIERVAAILDSAGYVPEEQALPGDRLTYRIERRPLRQPTWEPISASLRIVGQDTALLDFATNRNMVSINSFSTPPEGLDALLVDVGRGQAADFAGKDVAGRIVYGRASAGALFREAVQKRGAAGVLAYAMPAYTAPATHPHSIQFGSIPYDAEQHSWALRLSYGAREALDRALAAGPVRVRVRIQARSYPSEELTLVADARGSVRPAERFVFSAHVQEPGANDNASGVGALAEIARVTASLVQRGDAPLRRTITFLWGDEIASTRRYLQDDSARTRGVRWGLSLDMVGEDTRKTGGTFLIEKMPDPSAVWTRGDDHHTEWGGRPLSPDRIVPHYFNDVALDRCREQAADADWVVRTNPFEGGSDHVPFLTAGKPGLLFWHFTDVYYHTDGDRLDKVSPATLRNAGVCALVTALTLASADEQTTRFLVARLEDTARRRLATETALSRAALARGAVPDEQRRIVAAWADYYVGAIRAAADIPVGGPDAAIRTAIAAAAQAVADLGKQSLLQLGSS